MFEPAGGLLPPERIEKLVRAAIEQKKPFSLVRCGDGEAAVLGYPEFVHGRRYLRWMRDFFGPYADEPAKFNLLRDWLEWAISHADVVGTFREKVRDVQQARKTALALGALSHLTDEQKVEISRLEFRSLDHLIRPLIGERCALTTTNIHVKMEESGLLKAIASTAGRLNVITGNDIKGTLETAFPDTRIVQYRVPTEYKFDPSADGWASSEPHFPNVFNRIMDQIDGRELEGVTLIGAGPCGKVYASAIKEAGGVAIDIGSIMDVWAGRHTRSFMPTLRRRTLVAADA